MAEKNEIINDIFKPSKKGFLGSGIFGVTYKGSFILLLQSIDYYYSFHYLLNDLMVKISQTQVHCNTRTQTKYKLPWNSPISRKKNTLKRSMRTIHTCMQSIIQKKSFLEFQRFITMALGDVLWWWLSRYLIRNLIKNTKLVILMYSMLWLFAKNS